MPSVFTRIINRELPAKVFLETDDVIVIQDIRPKAPVHLLLIPKQETPDFFHTPNDIFALLNSTARVVADRLGIADHFRIVINNGWGQEVPHMHYHFLSDRGAEKLTFEER